MKSIRDRIVLAEIATLELARVTAAAVRHRVLHVMDDEAGQTPTEYLMIVGLMAAAIVTIFVTFFWGTVREAASSWASKVKDAVMGNGMQ